VTEAEWLACDEPWPMLVGLRGTASDRKLRLFAVACCRGVLGDVPDAGLLREAAEVAERFADGRAGGDELEAARQSVVNAIRAGSHAGKGYSAATSVAAATRSDWSAYEVADQAAFSAFETTESRAAGTGRLSRALRDRKAREADLLRDIFENPFRPAPRLDPAWLTWNGGTVRKLAQAVYDKPAFDRLPVLADALEDAGCAGAGLLGHLRGPGPHVRGCWALDLILGKE
jgi:hypothetical protein